MATFGSSVWLLSYQTSITDAFFRSDGYAGLIEMLVCVYAGLIEMLVCMNAGLEEASLLNITPEEDQH